MKSPLYLYVPNCITENNGIIEFLQQDHKAFHGPNKSRNCFKYLPSFEYHNLDQYIKLSKKFSYKETCLTSFNQFSQTRPQTFKKFIVPEEYPIVSYSLLLSLIVFSKYNLGNTILYTLVFGRQKYKMLPHYPMNKVSYQFC